MPIRLQNIGLRVQNAGAWILHIVTNVTGRTPEVATIVLLVVLGYIVLLIILIPIHRALLRLLRKRIEKLTREYDTLRYLVAKAQKNSGKEIHAKGLTALFDLPHPDYLHHHKEMKNEIMNIETEVGSKIIEDDKRKEIEKRQRKYRSLNAIVNVYGRIVSVITVLVYRLFW